MPSARRKHAQAPSGIAIPEKIYFRIGEVSQLSGLPPYVLRFWETEFAQLHPAKSSTGQRMYRRKDVEHVMRIRKLLYEDGFTIAGAREKLREEQRQVRGAEPATVAAMLAPVEIMPQRAAPNVGADSSQGELLFDMLPELAVRSESALAAVAQAQPSQSKDELRRVREKLAEVLKLLS